MIHFVHLIHSLDLRTGGVAEATHRLNKEFQKQGFSSSISDSNSYNLTKANCIIAHGLWQWPSFKSWKFFKRTQTPYLVFPHGMLDPWFKRNYPIKHLKKQLYWWWRQGKILNDAHNVCFTTEEERMLAKKTFKPYCINDVVTGLGVSDPPQEKKVQFQTIFSRFPEFKNKRVLLYLGRFHPKKGVDLLINAFLKQSKKEEILLLAGPINHSDNHVKYLQNLSLNNKNKIFWSDMIKGDMKWGALRMADALILPSHQENFGMVIAEALSVETPVFLTNKVNLWREVIDSGAGIVANDDQKGVDHLVQEWVSNAHQSCLKNTLKCFHEKLHISQTVKKILTILPSEECM